MSCVIEARWFFRLFIYCIISWDTEARRDSDAGKCFTEKSSEFGDLRKSFLWQFQSERLSFYDEAQECILF